MADIYALSALWRAKKYRDYEPLIMLLEEGNQSILADPRAREMLAAKLRGEKWPGRSPRSQKAEINARWAGSLAWYYHGSGMPKFNTESTAKTMSACSKVSAVLSGKIYSLSNSSIRDAINEFYDHPECQAAFYLGRAGFCLENPEVRQNWFLNLALFEHGLIK
jgi:hypothetical protein